MASSIRAKRDAAPVIILEGEEGESNQISTNVDFDELCRSDPGLKRLMDEIENEGKKKMISDLSPKALAFEAGDEVDEDNNEDKDEDDNEGEEEDEGWEDDDDEDDGHIKTDKERAEKKRLIAQLESKLGEGYDEGEAEYAAWLKQNNLVDYDDENVPSPSDADAEVSIFNSIDREFMAKRKQFDDNGNEVTDTGEVIGNDGQTRSFITADGLADLMKDIGFDEEENYLEERRARRRHIRAETDKNITDAAMKSAHVSLKSQKINEPKDEKYKRVPMGVSAPSSSFEDTFHDKFSLKHNETLEGIELEGHRKNMTNLLDNEEDVLGDEYDRKIRPPGSTSSLYDTYGDKKRESYDDHDIQDYNLKTENIKSVLDFTPEDIAHEWDMVEFGRCVV